ncbi:hypothetical protein MF672_006580 [Actinomadura sp. ATCC 31491]|uniref:Pectate lyase domain-containing protein n=1 Tax=Actinomadura luzonensis TaxID=2805427 RepID=A0ABT0FM95_9ACTN|nr:hypothetical protein [Actinomadura luzonensis]MCK2213459.1 hypothetical protein [Actinomadura luzonensis]
MNAWGQNGTTGGAGGPTAEVDTAPPANAVHNVIVRNLTSGGSPYVTVSWNHTHDHTKNMLLGHDDSNAAQDAVARLKVTHHHDWFDRTPQRNPRVRFGEPVSDHYTGPAARCAARNNVFADESGTPDCSGAVQESGAYYAYTLDDPATVPAKVQAGAGVGRIGR